jgi:hypothetical protein
MANSLQDLIADATASTGPAAVPVSRVSPGGVDPLGLRQINFRLMDMVLRASTTSPAEFARSSS